MIGEEGDDSTKGGLSGIYLGILNVFTTLPQFVGTAIATVVFAIFDPGKHHGPQTEGVNAISICLFIGAFAVLGAAYGTHRLQRLY